MALPEIQFERLANLCGNIRFVRPEAGDPFGGRQRPTNRIRRSVDVEREQYVSHGPAFHFSDD
jgi:hypothetical protein